jgi:uncharacterized protein YukE
MTTNEERATALECAAEQLDELLALLEGEAGAAVQKYGGGVLVIQQAIEAVQTAIDTVNEKLEALS